MTISPISEITDILCCPCCRSGLLPANDPARFRCSNPDCRLAAKTFPSASGQPVLIDFERSIVERRAFVERDGVSPLPRDNLNSLKNRVFRALFGQNRVTAKMSTRLLSDLKRGERPRVLVVGGGAVGVGMQALYASDEIALIGFDIYPSLNTTFVADGHQFPLLDGSVDAVWMQAVLEHVLDPYQVAAETYRVLKPGGVVFADSPFLWPVHEGAYDFLRFTASGHRWLFRRFELLEAGVSGGSGTAALWMLRYLARAILRNDKLATIVQMAFFWLRFLDYLAAWRQDADAASGVYFYGRKGQTAAIAPQDMVKFYDYRDNL